MRNTLHEGIVACDRTGPEGGTSQGACCPAEPVITGRTRRLSSLHEWTQTRAPCTVHRWNDPSSGHLFHQEGHTGPLRQSSVERRARTAYDASCRGHDAVGWNALRGKLRAGLGIRRSSHSFRAEWDGPDPESAVSAGRGRRRICCTCVTAVKRIAPRSSDGF